MVSTETSVPMGDTMRCLQMGFAPASAPDTCRFDEMETSPLNVRSSPLTVAVPSKDRTGFPLGASTAEVLAEVSGEETQHVVHA